MARFFEREGEWPKKAALRRISLKPSRAKPSLDASGSLVRMSSEDKRC